MNTETHVVKTVNFDKFTVTLDNAGDLHACRRDGMTVSLSSPAVIRAMFDRIVELETPPTGPVQLFREVPLVIDFLSKEKLYYGGDTPVEQDAENELLAAVANRYSLQQGNWSYVIRNDDGTCVHRNGDIVVTFSGNTAAELEDATAIAKSMNKRAGYTL